jgi:hypothetical protein
VDEKHNLIDPAVRASVAVPPIVAVVDPTEFAAVVVTVGKVLKDNLSE